MAVITAARFVTITDALAAAYLAAASGLGSSAVEEPDDDTGARGRLGDLNAAIMAYEEDDYLGLMTGIRASADKIAYQTVVPTAFARAIAGLDAICAAAGLTGVAGLESFATYYNKGSGGPWTAPLCPDFRDLLYLVNGSYPAAWNVYSPAVSNMGARTRTTGTDAAFVAGTDVDSTKYIGAGRLQAVISSFAGAAGVVQVIGNGRDATGVAITGHVWSGAVTADGTVTLAPAITGDVCYKVTNILLSAPITGAVVQINAAIPSGRTNPPE